MQRYGIKIHRFGARLKFGKRAFIRRIVLECSYFVCVAWFLLRNRKRFDAVVSVFPPSLFMLVVAAIFKGKCVGIVHDLQGVYAAQKAGPLSSIIRRMIFFFERRAFSACEKLIFLSREMQERSIESYGLDRSVCSVSYPFVTVDKFIDRNKIKLCDYDLGEWSLVYSGALGEKQAPQKLVELMKLVAKKDKKCRPFIFSSGPVFEQLKSDADNSAIEFRGLVSEEDLPELLMKSSVQILPQETGTSSGSLPSKLPNILAARSKLFVVTDEGSELADLLEDISRVSVETSWGNKDRLVRSVLDLRRMEMLEDDVSSVPEKFKIDDLVKNLTAGFYL